jgi:hypothetical protein
MLYVCSAIPTTTYTIMQEKDTYNIGSEPTAFMVNVDLAKYFLAPANTIIKTLDYN